MIKYKIIRNGEELTTRFDSRSAAERFASERYNDDKDSIDEHRANDADGRYWEDYPEYEIEAYETSALEEWKHDLRYSIDPYDENPFDIIDSPFEDANHPPCPNCRRSSMEYHGGTIHTSYWKCNHCGFSITQDELYNR